MEKISPMFSPLSTKFLDRSPGKIFLLEMPYLCSSRSGGFNDTSFRCGKFILIKQLKKMNLEIFIKIKILSHGAGRSERLASPGDIKHKISASKKGVFCFRSSTTSMLVLAYLLLRQQKTIFNFGLKFSLWAPIDLMGCDTLTRAFEQKFICEYLIKINRYVIFCFSFGPL